MNYQLTIKKVISSQYLFTGLRITAAAVIPALILYHYNVLALMSAIPFGALIVGSIDSPGPFEHRRNALLASICINLLIVVITISLNHNPVLVIIAIIIFGMFFSLIGIYGNRVNSIGLVALLVFIFNIDSKASFGSPWFNGLLFTAGGTCYFIISLVLHRLRPYRYLQLQLGENVRTIARYTETLAGLFKIKYDKDYLFNRLNQQQVNIQQEQDSLREMLLSTREMVVDSTAKGRIIMMMFLDSVDLFERLLSLQQDYTDVYEHVNVQRIASAIEETLRNMQQELNAIGYAVQFNHPSNRTTTDIKEAIQKLLNIFLEERKRSLNKNTLPYFIKLRQIVYALQDAGERINRLHRFSHYDKMTTRQYKPAANEELQMQSTEISPALFIENLTFTSSQFKHALRVTIALLIGYGVSLFFPLGHGYWILLTIAVILKPAYSISRTRNKQRLLGTITGVIAGFIFLYFVKNATLTFLLMLIAMIIAYSLLKLNYYISCVCITMYVLLSFHFLNNSNFTAVVTDRLIDTAIGCVIAFAASLVVFPVWEYKQMKELSAKLITANKKYFNEAALLLKSPESNLYKLARREAFVALANLNDSFQRILSEKRKGADTSFYHQMVASSYMMTAHIASLSLLISRNKNDLNDTDFEPLIKNVNDKFKRSEQVLNGEVLRTITSNRNAPITNKVQALLQQRHQEIEQGITDTQTKTRKMLSSIKTVTDELEIIDSIASDEIKILQRLN